MVQAVVDRAGIASRQALLVIEHRVSIVFD